MPRIQISLTSEQLDRVRSVAARRGTSLAALVREALDRLLAEAADEQVLDRALRSVGGFHSGHRSTSAHHDEVLAQP